MTQSRVHSFIEAWANTIVGFFVSLAMQHVVAIIYQYHTTFLENLSVVLIFTAASVVRNYALRRYFNKLHNKNNKGDKDGTFQASVVG